MAARHESPDSVRPGDRLVRAGALIFLAGVVAVVVGVVPSVLDNRPGPVAPLVVAVTLLPLGLGVALAGLLRAARTGRRQARAARRATRSTEATGPAPR